jgi:ABC-type multidrug transport system ATPase subunit
MPETRAHAIPAQRTASDAATPTALSVVGLVVDAPSGTRLLDRVGFAVAAGTLVGVAGPTGSGKTTFAGALTGTLALTSGSITVDGREVVGLDSSHRGIGYVPQEDALYAELTVRRCLAYAAALRMPDQGVAEQASRVDAVLDEVRLSAQSDLLVGSLSVGQRKRVCIAIELLSRPSVLVLDEPTSSLDPGYEASVMATLRRLADLGHVVIVASHSQAALAGCDQVALLSSGGRLAYFGTPAQMHRSFGTTTAAELFSALDGSEEPAEPKTQAEMHRVPAFDRRLAAAPRTSVRSQLATLTRRYFDLTFADRRRTWLFAAQVFVLGGLLAMFVAPDGLARPADNVDYAVPISATGMAVLLVMCVSWLGMASAVREIVKERRILVREHRAGLSAVAYVGSKIAVLGPLLVLQAAAVSIVAVQRQSVPGSGAVLPSGLLEIVVVMSLAAISAVTLSLFVSAVVRSADKALAVLPMLVVVEFVLSGLTPSVSWVPGLVQLRDLASTRWAVQGVGATVTGDAGSWLAAVGALSALIVVTLAATYLAVRYSLRLPTTRTRRSLTAVVRDGVGRLNPEMVRLSRNGAAGLAAVALLVSGARALVPAFQGPTPPILAASAHQGPHQALRVDDVATALPGLLSDMWWLWDAGTRFSIDVTEAAYLASKT